MKAVAYQDYNSNIEIIEVAKPELKDRSVLIEVHAASINPIDNILHAGYLHQMLELSFPHIMGYDVSGAVVVVGKDVRSVKVGDGYLHVQIKKMLAQLLSLRVSMKTSLQLNLKI